MSNTFLSRFSKLRASQIGRSRTLLKILVRITSPHFVSEALTPNMANIGGTEYPRAIGNFAAHNETVERECARSIIDRPVLIFMSYSGPSETGNMIIITLAHARATGD